MAAAVAEAPDAFRAGAGAGNSTILAHYFTLYSRAVFMPTFRRLLAFLKPYKRQNIWSIVLASLAMGFTVLIPALVGSVVNAVDDGDRSAVLPLTLAIVGAGLLRLGLTASRRVVAGRVSLAVEYDLRERIYEHLQSLELAYFDSQQTGQLMSRATVDLQSIRFFLGYGLIFITQSALTLVLAAAVMFWLQPGLAFLALLPVPFVVFTASRYNRTSRPALQEVQQRIAELTVEAEESVSGVRVVKAFAREEHMLGRFRNRVSRVFDQNVYSTRLRAFYNPLIAFLPNFGLAVVLLVGGRQVINGSLSLGAFTAFYTYLVMLIGPMRMLGTALGMSQRAIASGNRLFEVLDREPRITDEPDAPDLPPGNGHVVLADVALKYGTTESALDGVDLEVEGGKVVALVGPSGSGKTSLVALLARLYDPTRGSVTIDGADLREIDVRSLRRQIAFVADDSFLFSATVADNIAYARPDATREQVELAAERAQASSFIERLPDGYETMVGERGLTLSGGQRQRIAIARALLADPADPDPRRRDLLRRCPDRGGDQTRPRRGARGPDDLHRRSPALDHLARRRDRRPRRGTGGRSGHARGAHRPLPALSRDRRLRPRRSDVPAMRPRGARGGGTAVSGRDRNRTDPSSNGRRPEGPEVDARLEREDEARESETRAPLGDAWLLVKSVSRTIRGEDGRGRKVRWMLGLLRPYRMRVVLMMIALVIATAAALAPPLLAGLAIDKGIQPQDYGALTVIVIVFLASAAIYWAATYAQTYLVGWVGQRALQNLRERIYTHLQSMSLGFYTRNRPGVLISRMTNDVQALDTLVTDGIVTMVSSVLTLVGVIVILLAIDAQLALITFLTFPVLAVGSIIFRVASATAYRQTREKIANITAYLQETLSGVRVVRSFGQEPRHLSGDGGTQRGEPRGST